MKRLWVLMVLLAAFPAKAQETIPSIVVVADSTLALPLSRIIREYAVEKKSAVALSLVESSSVNADIAEGGGDVLITARDQWLQELKQQGMVDIYSETPLADDSLVLIGPPNFAEKFDVSKSFPTGRVLLSAGADPLFVMAYPQVLPEGTPSRALLRKLDALADMEPYTVYLKEREQMRNAITRDAAFGILLASDASNHSMNALGVFPNNLHPPVRYRAVVLAGENMDQARKFVEFMKSSPTRALFATYGFTPTQ